MKSGFVNIFGRPNAGKSTLLNLLMGEKLAIVSPKIQTTRHRIKGILSGDGYQVVLSDTPGIIDPRYKLHEKMMQAVKESLSDADLALLVVDVDDDWQANDEIFSSLQLKIPAIVAINKIDKAASRKVDQAISFFKSRSYCTVALAMSAINANDGKKVLNSILGLLPDGSKFYSDEELTDRPVKFFIEEMIREKIYDFFEEEIPYQATVVVKEFKEKQNLVRISAEIIVQRESQKAIVLGEKGKMIKRLGTAARQEIERFLQQKVLLELFVKVRPNWRENELHLKEYGY